MNSQEIQHILNKTTQNSQQLLVAEKILNNQRITIEDALLLYEQANLGFLSVLANYVREQKNGKNAYYNKNFHIEPTNICIHNCKFCSYSRKKGEPGAWDLSIEEMIEKVNEFQNKSVTEVHIVGGVHPDHDIHWYGKLIAEIKKVLPTIHVKAYSAVEIDYMISKAGLSWADGFKLLKEYGLDSIPGGGAEIFSPEVRKMVCDEKSTAEKWLTIHEEAHKQGIPSNATMLYGHVEKYEHRVHHLSKLRELQDKTQGFNAFIPLKYRHQNNKLSHIGEVSIVEDLRNYAVSRIFLDNFTHLKAYWPAIGKSNAIISLSFGVDDMDGTIDDTTKIYSMAGVDDHTPSMSVQEIRSLIESAGFIAIERDSNYQVINNQ